MKMLGSREHILINRREYFNNWGKQGMEGFRKNLMKHREIHVLIQRQQQGLSQQ